MDSISPLVVQQSNRGDGIEGLSTMTVADSDWRLKVALYPVEQKRNMALHAATAQRCFPDANAVQFPFPLSVSPGTTTWRWRIWPRRPSWAAGADRSLRRQLTLLKATSSGSTLSLMSTSPQSRDSASATPSCRWYVHHPRWQALTHTETRKAFTCLLKIRLIYDRLQRARLQLCHHTASIAIHGDLYFWWNNYLPVLHSI